MRGAMAVLGILMIVVGVVFGVWAGVWWAFIGGIVDVIQAVRAPDLVAMDVAIGVSKVVFSGVIGWAAAAFFMIPGVAMLAD